MATATCPTARTASLQTWPTAATDPRPDPLHYRKVGVRIAPDQMAACTTVGQGDLQARRFRNDMVVGEDETVGRKEHARPGAAVGFYPDHRRSHVSTVWTTASE